MCKEIVINGIEFECKEFDKNTEVYIKELANNYNSAVEKIVDYMIDDDEFMVFYGNIGKEELTRSLNLPKIRVFPGYGVIEYLKHTLDDEHIISLEFTNIFENLSYLAIEG